MVLRGLGCKATDRVVGVVGRGDLFAVRVRHGVPSFDLVHVVDRGGGPCHFVTIWAAEEENLRFPEGLVSGLDDNPSGSEITAACSQVCPSGLLQSAPRLGPLSAVDRSSRTNPAARKPMGVAVRSRTIMPSVARVQVEPPSGDVHIAGVRSPGPLLRCPAATRDPSRCTSSMVASALQRKRRAGCETQTDSTHLTKREGEQVR